MRVIVVHAEDHIGAVLAVNAIRQEAEDAAAGGSS